MSEDTERNCYLVRTLPELVEKGVVGVGWVDFRFDDIGDAEVAIGRIRDEASYGLGRSANQIRRFFSIADGDFVVAPLPHFVAIGRAEGGLFFDDAYVENDRGNQRRVQFPRDSEGHVISIPRSSFSEAFQRRINVRGMVVNDLNEFGDEIRDAASSIERGTDYSWLNRLHVEIGKREDGFKKQLLDNIQAGRTNLRTGGVGLEQLVRELLTIEGYKASVLSKRHFGGFADADVQASRSDRCSSVKLLVQVKHHQDYSDAHGIHQLEEIQEAHEGEYDDHDSVFLTSASVSDEVLKIAENAGITVIDGHELAEWISDCIEHLAVETKLALGIYEVPAVI